MNIFFIVTVLLGSPAFAASGDERGNGGDVVVCREADGKISSVEMLDYFEARELRSIKAKLPPGDSPEQIATRALARLYVFSPRRAAAYVQFIQNFRLESRFREEMEFVDISDSDHLFFPLGCRVEQLIIQQQVQFPEDSRFIVNEDLWKEMSQSQRAAAILHEAFYSEAITLGQQNSRKARYFHSKIVQDTPLPMRDKNFVKLLGLAGFPFCEIRALYVPCEDQAIPETALQFDGEGNLLSLDGRAARFQLFHHLVSPLQGEIGGNYPQQIEKVTFEVGGTGLVTRIHFRANASIVIAGQQLVLASGSALSVYPDRSLKFTTVRDEVAPNCYVDPADQSAHCGAVTLEASGRRRVGG